MDLIRNNIKELMEKCGYKWYNGILDKDIGEDKILNILFNCWMFFDEYMNEICALTGATKEVYYYSLIYWSEAFIRRYEEMGGNDDGFFRPNQKMYERIDVDLDWDFVAMIVEGKI